MRFVRRVIVIILMMSSYGCAQFSDDESALVPLVSVAQLCKTSGITGMSPEQLTVDKGAIRNEVYRDPTLGSVLVPMVCVDLKVFREHFEDRARRRSYHLSPVEKFVVSIKKGVVRINLSSHLDDKRIHGNREICGVNLMLRLTHAISHPSPGHDAVAHFIWDTRVINPSQGLVIQESDESLGYISWLSLAVKCGNLNIVEILRRWCCVGPYVCRDSWGRFPIDYARELSDAGTRNKMIELLDTHYTHRRRGK